MAIPDYQSIMLPLLKFAGDKQDHSMREAIDHIATLFNLSEQERSQPLRSRPEPLIQNRVGWARTYLKKAGLLESPRPGYFRIAEQGAAVLEQNLAQIDNRFLDQFKSFAEFRKGSAGDGGRQEDGEDDSSKTPIDLLEAGYQQVRRALAEELLVQIKRCSAPFFERLVLDLLQKMGYGHGAVTGRSGDGGIDGIIQQDELGLLEPLCFQAKKWENVVPSKEVRDFVGALDGKRVIRGVFITTSSFTKDARDFVGTTGHHKVILVEGEKLAELMIDNDVGVSKESSYEIKRVDADYFTEE